MDAYHLAYRYATWIAAPALAVWLTTGCGSGRSGGAPQEQTAAYGRLVTRVVGTAQTPVTLGGLGSVVTGVAGAKITSVTLTDAANTLDDTRIAYYAVTSDAPGLYLVSPSGLDPYRLQPGWFGTSESCWSPDGTRIVVDGSVRGLVPGSEITDGTSNTVLLNETTAASSPSNISIIQGDGSVRTVTSSARDTNASWWPAKRIVFESFRDGNSEIYVVNADGTGLTNLTKNPAADTAPCWSPDGNLTAYVSNRGGHSEILQMVSDGTSNTILVTSAANDWDPQYSPDGTRLCFVSNRDGNSEIYVADATGRNPVRLTTNVLGDFDPCWSPDSSRIAWTRTSATGTPEIWTMLASGTGQKRLVSNGARPSWSPFVSTRNLVGTGGALAESASGFLYGRRGDVTTSLLVFDTVTPAGARITAQTPAGLNAPNFVFEVTAADAIRSLSFQNDFYQRRIMVIDPATSLVPTVTGALVDFNASTGKVSSVLPYVANRADGSADRGPVRRGGALIFYRTFLSVWDGTGHNLAPHGATEARFDSRSGRLLSVH